LEENRFSLQAEEANTDLGHEINEN